MKDNKPQIQAAQDKYKAYHSPSADIEDKRKS